MAQGNERKLIIYGNQGKISLTRWHLSQEVKDETEFAM